MQVVTDAVVSPTGRLHAVRPGSKLTACGLDFHRTSFSRGYRRKASQGWTMMRLSFDELTSRRSQCTNCIANLAAGTGR